MSHSPLSTVSSAAGRLTTTPRTSLRVVPVPRHDPPYDDVIGPEVRARGDTPEAVQGSLALAFRLPSGVPAVPETATLRPVDEDDPYFGPQRTPSRALPDPRAWATLISQAVVEVLAGHRPAAQLVRWTSADVYTAIARQSADAHGARPVGKHARAVVRSVHVCEPVDGVAEVCAVVAERRHSWALVLRLEGVDHRWRCTVLD
ncbi:MAG: Rv3235 family protein, partial [Actinomycetes bacterium]